MMVRSLVRCTLAIVLLALCAEAAGKPELRINGTFSGPTPFISFIDLAADPPASLKELKFVVRPKAGSFARPVSGTYSASYLQTRGYIDPTGRVKLPVFGLYSDYANTVDV